MKLKSIKKSIDEWTFQPIVEVTVQIPLEPIQDAKATGTFEEAAQKLGATFVETLLGGITELNKHPEVLSGNPVGKELM